MRVRAELVQVGKARFVWVAFAACALALAFLFYQYTMNESAGVLDAALLDPANLTSLFLMLSATILAPIVATLLGSYLGAKDFGFGTAGMVVVWSGRLRALCGRLSAMVVACAAFVTMVLALGFGLGSVHGQRWHAVSGLTTLAQAGSVLVAMVGMGLMALAVGALCRSVAVGNIACLVFLLGQQVLPAAAQRLLGHVTPSYLIRPLVERVFGNLRALTYVQMPTSGNLLVPSLVWFIGVAAASLTALVLLARFREVQA